MTVTRAPFYIVPDGPGLAEAIRGTPRGHCNARGRSTNSWGFRGPEPDLTATAPRTRAGRLVHARHVHRRDETPPECLRHHLAARLETRVSVLNTGVMGYSPEQYYYTLVAFVDRFRPDFVVVSVYANDFGNALSVVSEGRGDWPESQYWIEQIAHACRARHCPFLVVPVPIRGSLIDRRSSGNYPGSSSTCWIFPAARYLTRLMISRVPISSCSRSVAGSADAGRRAVRCTTTRSTTTISPRKAPPGLGELGG